MYNWPLSLFVVHINTSQLENKNQHAFFKSPEYISEYISHDVALAWLVWPQWPVACMQTVVSEMEKHLGAPQRAAAITQSIFLSLF